jgi:hypothetical protein
MECKEMRANSLGTSFAVIVLMAKQDKRFWNFLQSLHCPVG